MLLIYYNPQKNSFYLKYVNSLIFDKRVGYVNQFGHVLVQCLFVHNNKFLSCNDFFDYNRKTKELKNQKETKKNKKSLISCLGNLLYKKR